MYCIMGPYTEGRLDRYRTGIPRELPEIRTQPWLSEGSLTCDPCHHVTMCLYMIKVNLNHKTSNVQLLLLSLCA